MNNVTDTAAAPTSAASGEATRRVAAVAALALIALAAVIALDLVIERFPRGLIMVAFLVLTGTLVWFAVKRRDFWRMSGFILGFLALLAALYLVFTEGRPLQGLAVFICLALSTACARRAIRIHVHLPSVPKPVNPILFWNPKSGDGKATKNNLEVEAPKRGIKAVQLQLGQDLEQLVRDAIAAGHDAVAMAGGDGSQALVAKVASELDIPMACIPAGTRNHFALDLGVDRDDVVGALDAFGEGAGERVIDLGEVNDQIFVNNVSLGLYAEAVQRDGYRDAKLRTIFDTIPDVLGKGDSGDTVDLQWTGPGGDEHSGGAAVLVSNNSYRMGKVVGTGTRPSIEDGLLGVTVMGAVKGGGDSAGGIQPPWRQWTATEFTVRADAPVPAGVDGEAMVFDPPLVFRTKPKALRVRIAPQHPGASPSVIAPESGVHGVKLLARIAAGRPA